MSLDSIGAGASSYAGYNKDVDNDGGVKRNFSPQDFANRLKSDLTTKLNLTADQQSKLEDILNNFTQNQSATAQSQQGGANPSQGNFKSVIDSLNSQISGILNPDQQATFNTLQSQKGAHAHHGHHQHGASANGQNANPATATDNQANDGSIDIKV